ncbi:MAG: hypothetical protein COY57_02025, partial [Flavobacteriales bacterium CG_4_10_14_0_8_um_filter_32_5]
MNRNHLHILIAFWISIISTSVVAQQSDSISHVIFLVGDAGEPQEKTQFVFDELLKQAKEVEEKSTIFFLGDNIYPNGLPSKNSKNYLQAKAIIDYQ